MVNIIKAVVENIRDRYVWITLITCLTGLQLYSIHVKEERENRRLFVFSEDFRVSKQAHRDEIRRGEQAKLDAIIRDDSIEKSNKPEFGAAISMTDGLSEVIKRSKMLTLKVTPLKISEEDLAWDYEKDGYKYIPNVYTEYTTYLYAMMITEDNIDMIKIHHTHNPISVPSMIVIGNLIVRNLDGSLYATTTLNFDMIAVNSKYKDRRVKTLDYLRENGLELDTRVLTEMYPVGVSR